MSLASQDGDGNLCKVLKSTHNNSLCVHCRSEKGVGPGLRGELGLTIHEGCVGPHYEGQLLSVGKPSEGLAQITL